MILKLSLSPAEDDSSSYIKQEKWQMIVSKTFKFAHKELMKCKCAMLLDI